MSEFVRTLPDDDLKVLRATLVHEFRKAKGTPSARVALDRLVVVDAEYCERERVSAKRDLTRRLDR